MGPAITTALGRDLSAVNSEKFYFQTGSRSIITGPADNLLNRERLRWYIRRRDRLDRRHRLHRGLDSFPNDWRRLVSTPLATPQVERTVWMFWHGGYDDAPALVQRCIDTWRQQNPEWQVRLLDWHKLAEFVDPVAYQFRKTPRIAHLSDLLRLDLLSRYGGVWADATTVCLRPLDDWIDRTQGEGFFAFTRPQPTRSIASWFLAAQPRCRLLNALRDWCHVYLGLRWNDPTYLFMHHTFDWLIEHDFDLRREWYRCTKISARGPHVMQRLIDGTVPADEQPDTAALMELPLLKLNRRKGYTVEMIDAAMAHNGLPTLTALSGH